MPERRHWSRHPVLSALLGVFAGVLTISLIEWLGHRALGSADAPDPAGASGTLFLVVLLAWLAGAGVGAWVAGRWAASSRPTVGLSAALVLWGATALTLWMLPHPVWASVAALLLMPLVGWLAASRAARGSA